MTPQNLNRLDGKVDDLEIQVLDMKAELRFERDRVDTLERFLNETGVDTRATDSNIASTKTIGNDVQEQKRQLVQLTREMKLLKAENGKLKTQVDSVNQELNKLKTVEGDGTDITKKLEEVIVDATKTSEALKDIEEDTAYLKRKAISRDSQNEVVAAVVRNAFRDEKIELKRFKMKFETQFERVLEAVNGSRESVEEPTVEMEAVLAEMTQIQLGLNTSHEVLQEMDTAMTTMKNEVAMLKGRMNSTDDKLEELKAFQQEKTGTTQEVTVVSSTVSPSSGLPSSVTLTPGGPWIYPVYGEAMKKHIKNGTRVVRGRDWSWRDQDGDGPGTVDKWMKGRAQVYVKWDQGKRANYRVGAFNKYDLYLYAGDATATPVPVTEASVTIAPGGLPVTGEELRKRIKIGSRVVRGRDWAWGNQDGGGPGTVDAWYNDERSQVYVTWDRGTSKRANYRIGYLNKYDLYLLA